MAEVTFDYQNLIEVEGGLQSGELDELGPRLREAADGLLGDPPGFMRLPKTGEYAEASARVAEEIRTSGATDFIHAGIGGSALGPMVLHKALNHPYYNTLSGEARRGPRLHFAENTDPTTLSAILDIADPEGTWVNVVTKSGSTAETMANFLVIRGALSPAAIPGLDVDALLRGAAQCAGEVTGSGADHPAVEGADLRYHMDTA